jgi:hypothetical protein
MGPVEPSSALKALLPSLLVAALLAAPAAASAQTIADSFDDWSGAGEQGVNNWFNGWFNLSLDPDYVALSADPGFDPARDIPLAYQTEDFLEFVNDPLLPNQPDGNHWNGTQWDFTPAAVGPWTEMGAETTHPRHQQRPRRGALDDPPLAVRPSPGQRGARLDHAQDEPQLRQWRHRLPLRQRRAHRPGLHPLQRRRRRRALRRP